MIRPAIPILMLALVSSSTGAALPPAAPQVMAQRALPGQLITFEFDQTTPTTDRIAILFSNTAIDPRAAPKSGPFGDGVVAFAFQAGASQKPATHVTFSTRATDRSFLDSRYISVVSTGARPWVVTTISLTVSGRRILDRVAMYPRKGLGKFDPKGLSGWNSSAWRPVYWETDLFRYTHPAKVY